MHRLLIFLLLTCAKTQAQNCTVNAGIDATATYPNYYVGNVVSTMVSLNGNSAGNINSTSNLSWETVSAPPGAIFTFTTPNNNTTNVNAIPIQFPSGIYVFRLGIDCQTGGRTFDTVRITFISLADYTLRANKPWAECASTEDSIKLTSRPLKTDELLTIIGSNVALTSSNANSSLNSAFAGPTTDSVRFTLKTVNHNSCNINGTPYFIYQIRNGIAVSNFTTPSVLLPNGDIGIIGDPKLTLQKTSIRKIDTLECISSNDLILPASNLCAKGGISPLSNYDVENVSIIKLSGSGILSNTKAQPTAGLYNFISNNWDTVTTNTMHVFEVTYGATSCYAAFKDTVRILFRSLKPFLNNIDTNTVIEHCFRRDTFPLQNYKFPLLLTGSVPNNFNFVSTLITPNGAVANIVNPNAKDTIKITGTNIIEGKYVITTAILDATSTCTNPLIKKSTIFFNAKNTLPILRDTTYCPITTNNTLFIKYNSKAFGNNTTNYNFEVIGSTAITPVGVSLSNDSTIRITFNNTPKTYNIILSPSLNSCTTGRRDTFNLVVQSVGQLSNAGTDQRLLCNVNTTNLAGSNPTAPNVGFWKFLPAISTNIGIPLVIADSTNRSTLISGFINQSSYYFSWNVNSGNTGSYCSLKPDTVLVVFSGTTPNTTQAAQANYSGGLSASNTYTLTSNAPTPTFNVQWNQLSGAAANIVNPNNQNTNVTGLTLGNYSFELVVSNACGVFKDTVLLNFTSFVVPVTIISISCNKENKNDIILWTVSDEINCKQYEIEISEDGNTFTTIGIVQTNYNNASTNYYSFTNYNIVKDLNYYRLKIVDYHGSVKYSSIIKLYANSKNMLEVYPIPATNSISINIKSKIVTLSSIEIILLNGQVIYKKNMELLKGINATTIDVANLPRGVMLLKIGKEIKKIMLL